MVDSFFGYSNTIHKRLSKRIWIDDRSHEDVSKAFQFFAVEFRCPTLIAFTRQTFEFVLLIALNNRTSVDATSAVRGLTYSCPNCGAKVILKKGRKVVHHFAHEAKNSCNWAKGETRAHLESKSIILESFRGRELRAEPEYAVNALSGDRRADVMVWSPRGDQIAIELQHSPIGVAEIEQRAFSYAEAKIVQMWIPFIRMSVWKDGVPFRDGWFVEKYSPQKFERWVHGFNGGKGSWMYDPKDKCLWVGQMSEHRMYVEDKTWYSSYGEENYSGGYDRVSKRYKELSLRGPFRAKDLLLNVRSRNKFRTREYCWPSARIAEFVAPEGWSKNFRKSRG